MEAAAQQSEAKLGAINLVSGAFVWPCWFLTTPTNRPVQFNGHARGPWPVAV